MNVEPRRGSGRPPRSAMNGGGAAPQQAPAQPKALTARQQVAALDAVQAAGMLLIEPPLPLAELNLLVSDAAVSPAGMEVERALNAKRRRALESWLQETAAAGFAWHLQRAWSAWQPSSREARLALQGLYDDLVFACQRREMTLRQSADAEGHAERALAHERQQLRQLEATRERERRKLEPIDRQIASKQAAIARLETEVAEQRKAEAA